MFLAAKYLTAEGSIRFPSAAEREKRVACCRSLPNTPTPARSGQSCLTRSSMPGVALMWRILTRCMRGDFAKSIIKQTGRFTARYRGLYSLATDGIRHLGIQSTFEEGYPMRGREIWAGVTAGAFLSLQWPGSKRFIHQLQEVEWDCRASR